MVQKDASKGIMGVVSDTDVISAGQWEATQNRSGLLGHCQGGQGAWEKDQGKPDQNSTLFF